MKSVSFALAGLCAVAVPALADDCKPLAIVTTINLKVADDHAAVFAPVKLGDKDALLLVDTGGAFSELTKETTDDLGLDHEPVDVGVVDVSGRVSYEAARVKSVLLGTLHIPDMDFMISVDNPFGEGNRQIAGILGPDVLKNYDTEFDFGTDKMTLLSPDHCPGKVIYWPAQVATAIPIKVAKLGHISFPVTLDGKEIIAMLDTGASETSLNMTIAESEYGVKPDTTGVSKVGELEKTHGAQVYHYKFHTLTFGDPNDANITVNNPEMDLLPNQQGDSHKGSINEHVGTRLASRGEEPVGLPDLLIGMNILKHLHIYIAYGEQKLYITPATAPAK